MQDTTRQNKYDKTRWDKTRQNRPDKTQQNKTRQHTISQDNQEIANRWNKQTRTKWSTHRNEMPTEIHKPNNNKAAMRVLLISLAALLSLELMTTVGCILINYTCVNKSNQKKRTIVSNLDVCIKRFFYQRIITIHEDCVCVKEKHCCVRNNSTWLEGK